MKYTILIFLVLLNINLLFGQKKLYDNVLNKVETNIDKNYYTDSIFAIRHSEYIINDSIKDFEKVVCIEYFPTPMWSIDGKFYNRKFGFNNSFFLIKNIGYLIVAKLYKKSDMNKLGLTVPHRFASSSLWVDINVFNFSLINFVYNNKKKREDLKNNDNDTNLRNKINTHSFNANDNLGNQKPKISIEYGNINDKKTSNSNSVSANNLPKTITMTSTPIYTMIDESTTYIVDNVIYEEIDCYSLTRINKAHFIYTEFERQRFENMLVDEYPNLLEQQKNEFKQLIEYWGNGATVFSENYIITKKNFAVLLFLREIKQQNANGEWIEIERITEKYREGKNKKYYQTYYARLVRNYIGSFPNINNLLTLVVRTPLERAFSLDNTTIIPRKVNLSYEDFCEKVDILGDDMLSDWNNFEKESSNLW